MLLCYCSNPLLPSLLPVLPLSRPVSKDFNLFLNFHQSRTFNRDAVAGSDEDWTKFNPWRAPGYAPVYDPCGRASGSYQKTAGKGEFTDTKFAKLGDLGSQVLPKYDTGTVWEAGSTVETMTSFRAVHGGNLVIAPLSPTHPSSLPSPPRSLLSPPRWLPVQALPIGVEFD